MSFGDFLKAGAGALGVDTDDIGGLFDKARGAFGGEGGADDIFGAAAKQFGIDSGDVGELFGGGSAGDVASRFLGDGGGDAVASTVGSFLGGGGSAGAGGSGGGFGDAISSFFGGGDAGGVAQQALGSFGSIFGGGGGGDIASTVSQYLPTSVTNAFAEAADLPFVQEAAGGNWAELAGSVPGLDGALGSFGLTTQDVGEYMQSAGIQAVDGGSGWTLGSMITDRGTEFLRQVASPVDADGAGWAALPGLAQRAGVDLPSWAADVSPAGVISQGGRFLDDGGYLPSSTVSDTVDNIWGGVPDGYERGDIQYMQSPDADRMVARSDVADDMTGEQHAPAAGGHRLDEFEPQPTNTGVAAPEIQEFRAEYDTPDYQAETFAEPQEMAAPDYQEAPAPTEALETGLEDLGGEVFDN